MIMKLVVFYVATILGVFSIFACSSDEKDEFVENVESVNYQKVLNELDKYMKFYVENASNLYDSKTDNIDLDALDNILNQSEFSVSTRTLSEDVFLTYKDGIKSELSEEAYNLVMNFVSKGKNSSSDFELLKNKIQQLNENDRNLLNFVIAASEVFSSNIMSVQTRSMTGTENTPITGGVDSEIKGAKGLPCNLLYSVAGTVTGSIWTAAFGGPIGYCVGLAWGIATTVVAYRDC